MPSIIVPILAGPDEDQLRLAMETIANVNGFKRGRKHPMNDLDIQQCSINLVKTQLSWTIKGVPLNFNIKAQTTSIKRYGDQYEITFEARTYFIHLLRDKSQKTYHLWPGLYKYTIIYYPDSKSSNNFVELERLY
ncbi:MAG: hypothetical protein K6C34_00750 [Alphaproteobacteria bacterium]|nr:hypothetical protein [Alphaproteobacteria bacterium]